MNRAERRHLGRMQNRKWARKMYASIEIGQSLASDRLGEDYAENQPAVAAWVREHGAVVVAMQGDRPVTAESSFRILEYAYGQVAKV